MNVPKEYLKFYHALGSTPNERGAAWKKYCTENIGKIMGGHIEKMQNYYDECFLKRINEMKNIKL